MNVENVENVENVGGIMAKYLGTHQVREYTNGEIRVYFNDTFITKHKLNIDGSFALVSVWKEGWFSDCGILLFFKEKDDLIQYMEQFIKNDLKVNSYEIENPYLKMIKHGTNYYIHIPKKTAKRFGIIGELTKVLSWKIGTEIVFIEINQNKKKIGIGDFARLMFKGGLD